MKKKKIIVASIFLIIAILWMIFTNITVALTHYKISFASLPVAFDGYKIVQISDFHNADFGNYKANIIKKIRECNPNIIAITGDLIDSNNTNLEIALAFVGELVNIAPCYYVTGNHEAWIEEKTYQQLEAELMKYGMVILRDSEVILSKDNGAISLIGIDDPDYADRINGAAETMAADKINALSSADLFTILLSHRPEYYKVYKETEANLVLSGHAHGGQFRLPFLGGLIAPNQGLFPEYDSGVYQENEFAMVVSRGIGNSIIPVRVNNQPEIVLVELCRGERYDTDGKNK